MTSAKRIIIATLMGVCCGVICLSLAASGGDPVSGIIKLQILISRTLLGFVIGISAIRMPWFLHGLIMGILLGLPMALGSSLGAGASEFTPQSMFFYTLFIGGIYGILIEFITSVVFRAKQKSVII